MEKNIVACYGGVNARVGELLVNRLAPNSHVSAIGPFVFLDHIYPTERKPGTPKQPAGEFAHPHRGIATLSYLFSGGLEHFDSRGHHGVVGAGGLQWMKAGNGIILDEHFSQAFQREGGLYHGLQFWVNLPAKNKAEAPEYLAVQADGIPEGVLPDNAGIIRILVGELGDLHSPVTTYTRQFLYHIRLHPKSTFTFPTVEGMEYAAFVPSGEVKINKTSCGNSELLIFGDEGTEIVVASNSITGSDILLFGGAPYDEPIVAEGPFVMNSHTEIAGAYRDFFDGKYGCIDY